MPDPVELAEAALTADFAIDPVKVKEVKQQILASGLLGKGDALAEVLQDILNEPDPVLYKEVTHQVFTQGHDEFGAQTILIEGDVTGEFSGAATLTDKGQRLLVVSAEYQIDKDWTILRFPVEPLPQCVTLTVSVRLQ